tara:strand:+ start:8479 stop:9444 length:966 start_codon:yes stop_codon:yes gene_type:complete
MVLKFFLKKMINKILKKILKSLFKNLINTILYKRNIIVVFRNGSAIGDHVYMTSVLREIALKKIKIVLFSNFYELFENNYRIHKLFRPHSKSYIWFFLNIFKGKNILEFRSQHDKKGNKHFLFYHKSINIHLSQAMSEHFNIDLNYRNFQNEFFFSKEELIKFKEKIKLPNEFALIQSSTKQTYTSNKDWSINGMQGIIDHFKNINWIQIGKSDEPKLDNCQQRLDLNLRELAYVIYRSNFIVSYEGLFNHLASCFNKKIFLIHTGFLPVEAFKYKNNIIIENNKDYPCYPCFDIDCKSHKQLTKQNIRIEKVIKDIENKI